MQDLKTQRLNDGSSAVIHTKLGESTPETGLNGIR